MTFKRDFVFSTTLKILYTITFWQQTNEEGINRFSTPKILYQICDVIRLKYYSYSMEKTGVHWAKRYNLFLIKRQLEEIDFVLKEALISQLDKGKNVSSTISIG